MAKILVKVLQLDKVSFIDYKDMYKKPLNEEITIGRADDNDIRYGLPFVSRKHGRIFVEKGIFSTHLDYEDYSKFGSTIIHWEGLHGKSKNVKGEKIKIKPGDWIIISRTEQDGMKYGLLLIPLIG